jgi:transmembrane sensor
MDTDPRQRVLDDAARWYARLHAPDCTPEDRAEFAAWRDAETLHSQAYAAAERLADGLLGAAACDPRLEAMATEALATPANCGRGPRSAGSVGRPPRRWSIPSTLAASIFIAAVAIVIARVSLPGASAPITYVTTTTDQRDLVLDDGTAIRVDVRSELEVRMTRSARVVTLRRGRAIFDVAHDPARPFSVAAGAGRVTALGTLFQVEKTYSELVVTLAEGAVMVSGELDGRGQTERLAPGQELSMSAGERTWVKRNVDASAATSWSQRRHVFRDARLSDAIDEINRYAAKKVRLADPLLADLPVSGTFVTGNGEAIAAAFAALLPIRIADAGDELLLFRGVAGDTPPDAVDWVGAASSE